MKTVIVCLSIIFLFACMACTQAPKQLNSPLTYQKKVQAAHHWAIMAEGVARNVKLTMRNQLSPLLSGTHQELGHDSGREIESEDAKAIPQNGNKPVYIDKGDKSTFGNAMRSLLITECEKQGICLTSEEESSYKLDWSSQKIYHNAERKYLPGLLAVVFLDIPQAILGGGDVGSNPPHCEILITFNLRNSETTLLRRSHIIYVCAEDFGHYWDIPDNKYQKQMTLQTKQISYDIVNQ